MEQNKEMAPQSSETETTIAEPIQAIEKPKKTNSVIMFLAIFLILAITAAAVFAYLYFSNQNTAPTSENGGSSQTTPTPNGENQNEASTDSIVNPILSSASSQDTWSMKEERRLLGEGTPFEMSEKPYLILKVRDGIIECQMGDRILPDETCTINGLENKVYKMVSISEGHDGGGIGFITENGDVYFLSVYVTLPENNAFYPEKLTFDKKVVDILTMDSMDTDKLTGNGGVPVVVFKDGTYSSFSIQE